MGSQDTTTLTLVDRERDGDPEAALRAYASADPAAVVCDSDRMQWITEQIVELPPVALHPLLELAITDGVGLAQRRAAHLMAIVHWYGGNAEAAEGLWLRAVELGREAADETWGGCIQNLAMAFSARGRFFEGLVLLGMAVRAARDRGDDFSQSFALVKRATALIQFDAVDAAEGELRRAEELWVRVTDERRRLAVITNGLLVWSTIYNRRKQWNESLRVTYERLELYEEFPPASSMVLLSAHGSRICALFELEPGRRGELIEEFRGLGDRFGLEESWRPALQNDVEELRLRHAIEDTGDRDEGLRSAGLVLEYYRDNVRDDDLIRRADSLGRYFTQLGDSDGARAAYDLAATAVLGRVMQMERSSGELPEVAEATAEDLKILNEHRQRLVERRGDLYEAIMQLWKPGNPAFDLVAGEGDLICICAWCQRVRTTTGSWIPIAQFFPDPGIRATHGICAECRASTFG